MTRQYYLIVGLVNMILFLGLQVQLSYGQSLIENISSGNGSMISDNTNESFAEQVVDSKSLMLGIPERAGILNETDATTTTTGGNER
ncbi:MAG: hypothetical protein ACM3X1_07160 [Ignavibacteriales bacterium]